MREVRPSGCVRVFSLTTGADTAGIGYGLAHAFRTSKAVDLRAMVATRNYIGYPVDLAHSRSRLERFYDRADVVMLHNTLHAHDWYDAGQGKPTVLMHHGRTPMEPFLDVAERATEMGAVQVGSTLDLTVFAPIEWAPPPVDIPAMRKLRAKAPRTRTLRIGHAPTNRAIKGTDAFLAAIDSLSRRFDIEAILVEGMPWRECLARKATFDILFDQPTLGYGSNAIEAWAMGIPVLAGVEDPAVRAAMIERWGVLPFMETSEATIEADLGRIVTDPTLRSEYARIGSAHVERWHAEPVVAKRMADVFQRAQRTVPGGDARRRNRPRILTTYAVRHTIAGTE